MDKKRGRPQRYVLWKDWENWLLKEWHPFKENHFKHLKFRVDISLWLSGGILLILIGKLVLEFFWG